MGPYAVGASSITVQQQLNETNRYERLDTVECIKKYGKVFLADRRNLVIVGTNVSDNANNSMPLQGIDYYYTIGGPATAFDWYDVLQE